MTVLDASHCYRALTARDARFDGVFFVAVETTGIYCRPVRPARTPRESRCRFFAHAAVAERFGCPPTALRRTRAGVPIGSTRTSPAIGCSHRW